MRRFRFFVNLSYALVAAGGFFLTTEAIIPFAGALGLDTQRLSATSEVMFGISGAAALLGIIYPTVVQRCFVNKKEGRFTRFGRWAMHTFRIPEDRVVSALSFRWYISVAIAIIFFLVSLLLSF